MKVTPITLNQFNKIVRAFAYIVASFVLAAIPSYLSKNNTWLAMSVPINLLLVTVKQLVTQDETQAIDQLTPGQQEVMHGVEDVAKEVVTDEQGNPVTDPNAAR